MKKTLMLFILPVFLFACSEDKPTKPKPGNEGQLGEHASGTITVTNARGDAVVGAKVLIGDALNSPFANNFLTTNAKGQVAIPAAWTGPQAVTVQADGYVRLTHFAREPKAATLQLRDNTKDAKLELRGSTTGHPIRNYDGYVDFGLVISALTRYDLLALDLNRVISSQTDRLSAVGQSIDIPSNITLPRQTESYIIPITLEKGGYRLYFANKGVQRVFAAQGRFPFRKVLDEMQKGKSLPELINNFTITGGVVRDINVQGTTKQDLPVGELRFDSTRRLQAPALKANEVMLALATADLNGWFVPTDMKRISSGQAQDLSIMSNASTYAVAALKNQDEFSGANVDRVSAVIMPFTNGLAPRFLPLLDNPRVLPNGNLQLPRPSNLNGVNELATHALYSEVKEIEGEGRQVLHLWEVFAPDWVADMNLPQWPGGTPQPTKKRWEVTYLGSVSQNKVELGQPTLEASTHVTHSSLDF